MKYVLKSNGRFAIRRDERFHADTDAQALQHLKMKFAHMLDYSITGKSIRDIGYEGLYRIEAEKQIKIFPTRNNPVIIIEDKAPHPLILLRSGR